MAKARLEKYGIVSFENQGLLVDKEFKV